MISDVPRMPTRPTGKTFRSTARTAPGVASAVRTLAKRVRALREAAGLSQEEAAARGRLDAKHWQAIEGAQTNPTIATLVGVARALRVPLAALFVSDAPT